MALAERSLAAGTLEDAESFAVSVLLVAPASQESLYLLGRVLDAAGSTNDALECHRGRIPEALWCKHVTEAEFSPSAAAHFERVSVFEAGRVAMPEPAQIAEPGPDVFNQDDILTAPCFVDRVSNGSVWQDSHNTLIMDASGASVAEHVTGNPHVVRHLSEQYEPMHFHGRAFVLGARGSGNYYHWMTDILPKLELCHQAGWVVGPDDHVIVPTRRSSFQLQSLQRFGIEERQVHVANVSSPWVTADELIVPHLRNAMGTTMGAWLPDFLKRSFLPDGPSDPPERRIFVSRDTGRAQGRGIENLAEVERAFMDLGFEIVFPETLDVMEQAALFAESAVVAGPHGAGLTNIVFCAPGTRVIEFYGAHLAPCYRAISALSGLDYHAHYCLDRTSEEDMDDRARSLVTRRTEGFSIPSDAIAAMVELACAPRLAAGEYST